MAISQVASGGPRIPDLITGRSAYHKDRERLLIVTTSWQLIRLNWTWGLIFNQSALREVIDLTVEVIDLTVEIIDLTEEDAFSTMRQSISYLSSCEFRSYHISTIHSFAVHLSLLSCHHMCFTLIMYRRKLTHSITAMAPRVEYESVGWALGFRLEVILREPWRLALAKVLPRVPHSYSVSSYWSLLR